ncbi:MAG: fibronectin type III domain-containing protein, partial [Chloroflexi bacterium]
TDNSTNEAGFTVERSTNGGVSFLQIGSLAANVTRYSNTNLTAGAGYSYRVRAYEGSNYSAYSNTAAATTLPPPAAPGNLTASAQGARSIRLTWTDNSSIESGFRIDRSTDGVNFTQLGLLTANTTSYTNGGLTSGVTYFYRVRAYDGANFSAYSNVASATAK